MDKTLALELASHGIVTQQDLADQAVDDLVDIGVDEARAAALIMAARAPLFARESTA